ncbi:MAG: ferrochelatase [Candidatus Eremiobacteraeota bacterium]|nr:ferrochelatase [Candidatus Eremiobacteraeota bacterium]MBV8671741.1 ferrochelatase [Candidatus Eremiobacteraeota bacterium]
MNMQPDALPRTGVVLTQVGGPDDLAAVGPYLRSFFSDPDLIRLPRWLKSLQPAFAWSLATFRAPYSRKLYASIGGGSPIRAQTQAQASALSAELRRRGMSMPVLVAMRHSQPNSLAAMRAARDAGLTRLIVIGLFPQYSFSTTLSGMTGLKNAMDAIGYRPEVVTVDEYCDAPRFVEAVADVTARALRAFATPPEQVHLIFSAHGLPMSYIEEGDPYEAHVQRSVAAVQAVLRHPGPIHTSYQSKLGPQRWLEPASDALLRELGEQGAKAVCMVPIAFVSEHVETLNEIDIQYGDIAKRSGIAEFHRACAVKCHPAYIRCLADQTEKALTLTPLVPAGT